MIAVVTSTIKPSPPNKPGTNSFYSYSDRLQQTKETLAALQANGFSQIFLVDNSPTLGTGEIKELLIDYPNITTFHIQQYQFVNKGINELLMLLYLCKYLPTDSIIFKISGRYKTILGFTKPEFTDMAVKDYQFNSQTGCVSTRAYWIKNVALYEEFLLHCLNEVYAYPERILGFKGLFKKTFNMLTGKTATPLNISIEFATANVLKHQKYHVTLLKNLGIEGLVAGSDHKEYLTE